MRSLFCVLVISTALISVPLYGDVIVPGGLTSVEGNSNNGFPFNLGGFGLTSQRYQQVYAASEFGSVPVLITGIAFRPDAQFGGAFSAILSNVQIDLSTTTAAPDSLSATFSNNIGADVTTVRSGSLPLSSSFTGPAGGPKDFDIVIPFTTPFLYDPTLGNLLLDVRNFSSGTTTTFDAEASIDSISRLFSLDGVGATSGLLDTSGVVTKFQVSGSTPAVPEPSSFLLLTTGLAMFGLGRFRGNRHSSE
jgi:hypothetical protein